MRRRIYLKANSRREYFLIHGYSGGPDDFNKLPYYLHEKYKVNVKIVFLKGHGTSVKDLDGLKYEDFLNQVEDELKESLAQGKEVVLGGFSFGAQLALLLAAKHPVEGIFLIGIPYKLKFPFNIPKLELLGFFKKYWLKGNAKTMGKIRNPNSYYQYIHINGSKIIKEANYELKKIFSKIKSPLLLIHSSRDRISNRKSVTIVEKKVSSQQVKKIFFETKIHNVFYSKRGQQAYETIGDFFEKRNLGEIKNERIAAIVPAYNEALRIESVLTALSNSPILDEIIVVDDGSTDNTFQVASKFPKIKVIRNKENKGKAYAMERGVRATDASILFFCDADLKGLTPQIVEQIIEPVLRKEYDMFIGIRNNVAQKAVKLAAINSGERTLRRELWEKVPKEFKYRYRIEAGLNYIAKKGENGYGWRIFNYYQTLKEKKYGVIKGEFLRWWMNLDILFAYFLIIADKILLKRKNN